MPPPKKKLPTGPARSDALPSNNWRSQLKQAATEPFLLPEEQDPNASDLSSPSPEIRLESTTHEDPDAPLHGTEIEAGFSISPTPEDPLDLPEVEDLGGIECDGETTRTPALVGMPALSDPDLDHPDLDHPDLDQRNGLDNPDAEDAIGIPLLTMMDADQPQTLLGLSPEALALLDPLEQQTQLPADLLLEAMLTTWPTWPDDMQQRILRQSHSLKVERLLKAQAEALATLEQLLIGSPDWPMPKDPNPGSQ